MKQANLKQFTIENAILEDLLSIHYKFLHKKIDTFFLLGLIILSTTSICFTLNLNIESYQIDTLLASDSSARNIDFLYKFQFTQI